MKKDDLTSFDMSTIEIKYENIKLFYDELIKRGYAIKTQKHVKKIINELLFFFFYYDISINSNNILLWSKYVYENIVKDLEYRSFGIKFIEYLENGDFINKNSYFNSVDGNEPPVEAKKLIHLYSLGYIDYETAKYGIITNWISYGCFGVSPVQPLKYRSSKRREKTWLTNTSICSQKAMPR